MIDILSDSFIHGILIGFGIALPATTIGMYLALKYYIFRQLNKGTCPLCGAIVE